MGLVNRASYRAFLLMILIVLLILLGSVGSRKDQEQDQDQEQERNLAARLEQSAFPSIVLPSAKACPSLDAGHFE